MASGGQGRAGRRLRLACVLVPLALAGCRSGPAGDPLAQVDPLIGTAPSSTPSALAHSEAATEPKGQTFPAVGPPWAMTAWTPQTQDAEQKCIAPYYYQDGRIQGFRGSHWLSGSCTQDYGSVTIMPVAGTLRFRPDQRASAYSHAAERASPAHYAVRLVDYGIDAELTATSRAAILRFTFTRADSAFVVLNPNSDEGQGSVRIDRERREISGANPVHRIYQGWGEPAGFSGYFVAVFDRPFASSGTWRGDTVQAGATVVRGEGAAVGAFVRFELQPGETVEVRIGTSFTSIEEARRNLQQEVGARAFAAVRGATEQAWNDVLRTVEVSGGTAAERTIFYTALYHALLLPRTFSDAAGSYPSFAGGERVMNTGGWVYYDDFSAWDTYRALHPLLTLLAPERTRDMVRSLVAKAEQGGWLPIFPCWNSYTAAMIGDHLIPIMVDAYLKGIRDFDVEKAYGYMLQNATRSPTSAEYVNGKGRRALDSWLRFGFIPLEDSVKDAFHRNEQVSRTLEYAFDDFALAQLAGALGRTSDQDMLMLRAGNWRNVFDPATGIVRGRHADSSWVESFAPDRRESWITEGTPRQYTWYVPHDVPGLIAVMGGRDAFIARLDTLFEQGLYWHGNEPGHQVAYLYDYAGAPWKTQQRVREILRTEYGNGPGGLSGNDDAGQLSAWYVLGAMGLYQVAPGVPVYALGSPAFERIRLHPAGGRRFTIRAEGTSDTNRYIQSATLNGEPFARPWLTHQELLAGGELVLRMGAEPERSWGAAPGMAPPSVYRVLPAAVPGKAN